MKNTVIVLICFFCLSITTAACFAQETFTLTTYYPAPFGVYRELRSQRMAIGEEYLQSNDYCWPGSSCTNTIPSMTGLTVDRWVGIGTHEPSGELHIKENYPENGVKIDHGNHPRLSMEDYSGITFMQELDAEGEVPNRRWDMEFYFPVDCTLPRCGIYMRARSADQGVEFYGDVAIKDTVDLDTGNVLRAPRLGVGVPAPRARLDVDGGVQIGYTNTCAADGTNNGTVRYNGNLMQYCKNGSWLNMSGGDFGGMFDIHGFELIVWGCAKPNPYTGSCSCPPGYNTEPIGAGLFYPLSGWWALSDHWIFYCWR